MLLTACLGPVEEDTSSVPSDATDISIILLNSQNERALSFEK